MTTKIKPKTIHFEDFPDFKPNLTPKQIFQLGSFGGTYWRPIHKNKKTNQYKYKDQHKEFPASWWKGLTDNQLTTPFENYDKSLNTYKVQVGTTLEFWIKKKWINDKYDPYGWVQWYCRFYKGRRCADDKRQIGRWKGIASENGRFRKWLVTMILKKPNSEQKYNNFNVSPKIRQTLQHWGYQLTKIDFDKEIKSRKN